MHEVTPDGVCGHTDKRMFRLRPGLPVLMHRRRVSGKVVQLIAGHLSFGAITSRGALSFLDSVYKFKALDVRRNSVCPFEMRASSIRWSTSSLERILDQQLVPRSLVVGCLRKRMVLCDAHGTGLSRRAS